jgi:hypothetical protein
MASAHASQPGWPCTAATLCTWVKEAAPAAPPMASMMTICTAPSARRAGRGPSGSADPAGTTVHLPKRSPRTAVTDH